MKSLIGSVVKILARSGDWGGGVLGGGDANVHFVETRCYLMPHGYS